MFFGISEIIPENKPDDGQRSFLGLSGTFFEIIRHFFWDCHATFFGSHTFFCEFEAHFTDKINIFEQNQ